jgi:hypothetical protein
MRLQFLLACMLCAGVTALAIPGKCESLDKSSKVREAPIGSAVTTSAETGCSMESSAERRAEADESGSVAKAKADRRSREDTEGRFGILMILLQVLRGSK